MSENSFLKEKEFYKRNINPLSNAIEQMATALAVNNGVSFEEAKDFLVKSIKEKKFTNLKDPRVTYFGKDENGDRVVNETPLSHYIKDTVFNKQVLAPTFTCYANPEEENSPLADFMQYNIEERSRAKKKAQAAEASGDTETHFLENINQANKKENNNSLSGALTTDSSIFENDTGHNTLTSTTRLMASVANALNEKMLYGNRHYRTKDIILNNIISTIHSFDRKKLRSALKKYDLNIPTVEDVLRVIKKSARYYIFDELVFHDLKVFVSKLDEEQRTAFVYSQDFYHIRELNPDFVKKMLTDFSSFREDAFFEDPISIIKKADDAVVNYAHQVCLDMVRGLGKDYSKMPPKTLSCLASSCQNINNSVSDYRELIDAFFLTETVPSSVAYIQDMVREGVPLSDTDSTMFSVDNWVLFYFGELNFTQKGFGISGAVAFLATQCISHCLAIMSGNMAVAKKHIFTLSMKPEYVFPVFVQSPVSKHYFTAILIKEGSVYTDIKMEIKGVHNINSAVPASIIGAVHQKMKAIVKTVMEGKKIKLKNEIIDLSLIENRIIESLKKSEVDFFKRGNIQHHTSYKLAKEKSPYAVHLLWERVFSLKYGSIEEPPYEIIKVPTILDSPTRFKKWLLEMKDRDIAKRLEEFSLEFNKKQMPTFYFSLDMVLSQGIPDEVVEVMDFKRIVLDLTGANRMLLDSLGYPLRNDLMVSDFVGR